MAKKLQTTGRCPDGSCCAPPVQQCNCLLVNIFNVFNNNCASCQNCESFNNTSIFLAGSSPSWLGSLCPNRPYEICDTDHLQAVIEFESGLWWLRLYLVKVFEGSEGGGTQVLTPAVWQKSYESFPDCNDWRNQAEQLLYNPAFTALDCDFSNSAANISTTPASFESCLNLTNCPPLPPEQQCTPSSPGFPPFSICLREGGVPTNYLVTLPANAGSSDPNMICGTASGSFLTVKSSVFSCTWAYTGITPSPNPRQSKPVGILVTYELVPGVGIFLNIDAQWQCGTLSTGGSCFSGGARWRIQLEEVCPGKVDCFLGGGLSVPLVSQGWFDPGSGPDCNNCDVLPASNCNYTDDALIQAF
jgi:hypothetical protein